MTNGHIIGRIGRRSWDETLITISASIAAARSALLLSSLCILSACATAPLERSGSLSSYDKLTSSDGVLTKSMISVSKDDVLAAKSVQIVPTSFSPAATQSPLSEKQRRLVSNAVDRALCADLSERFRVTNAGEPADLTVHAVVTHVEPTNELAAGMSKVVAIVPTALSLGYPVPVPRLPIGLGSLSIEAEAHSATNEQKAAMVWGRGADSITSQPRVSSASDAYQLATSFGDDFSKLLITGESPFASKLSMPSMQKIGTNLGGAPKYAACEAFGRDPGVVGMVGGGLGLPPEWSDKGGGEQ